MKVFVMFPDLMGQLCAPAEEHSQTLHGASRALCTHSAVNSQAERGWLLQILLGVFLGL